MDDRQIINNSVLIVYWLDGQLKTMLRRDASVKADAWAEQLHGLVAAVAKTQRLDAAKLWLSIDKLRKQPAHRLDVDTPADFTNRRIEIIVPPGFVFGDLQLEWMPGTGLAFAGDTLAAICKASGIDPQVLVGNGDLNPLIDLLTDLHKRHVAMGGAPDPVFMRMVNDVLAATLP